MKQGLRWRRSSAASAIVCVVLGAGSLGAQTETGLTREQELLREASSLEAAGAFPDAERLLRQALGANPFSLSAILQLERVLTIQGRADALIPVVDRLLEKDATAVLAHQIRVRAYAMLDRRADLEAAGEAWMNATPNLEIPYRELARVWRQRGELERAIDILSRGKNRIKRADALALELGDALADAHQPQRAVLEWNRAIGADGHGFLAVQRRLQALPDGGAALIPGLVNALTDAPTSLARKRAAAILAIDAGMGARAEKTAREVLRSLVQRDRHAFLLEMARRSEGQALPKVAYWAYSELLTGSGGVTETLAIRTRMAELALSMGDTARAAGFYREVERAFQAGAPERRQALAVRIQLIAREGDVGRALNELNRFRAEDPQAPELDDATAAVANALLDRSDMEGATDVLTGVSGPRTRVALARILVRRGEISRARLELLGAAPQLHGQEATEAIALAAVLGRLSVSGGELVGRAAARDADITDRADAVSDLMVESVGLDQPERAAVLEYAVGLAERAGLQEQAEEIRRDIVDNHPASPEAPGALLALARSLELRGRPGDEVRLLLEKLVLDYPRSALVPQARRELDRIVARSYDR